MKDNSSGENRTLFGGVIFCRSDRADITSIKSLKGQSFMGVDETSLGGWRAAWREFKANEINPYRDFSILSFGKTHDDVVYAVRDGKVDAGTVASSILEQMTGEGRIDPGSFKVINQRNSVDFPLSHSTRLYPRWPFAKLKHTPNALAEKVAIALLTMPQNSPAAQASDCGGWTVPLDYGSVDECLKELRIGIYMDFGKITLTTVRTYYKWHILFAVGVISVLTGFLLFVLHLNHRLRSSELALKEEILERKRAEEGLIAANQNLNDIIEFLPDATFVIDKDKKVIAWNRAIENMTGVSKEDMIGKGDYAYTVPFYGERRPHLLDLIDISDKDLESKYQNIRRKNNILYAETHVPCLYESKGAYVFATGAPLFDAHGNRVGAIESIRDITDRKHMEEALEGSEQQLADIINFLPDATFVIDQDGKVIAWNRAMEEMTGMREVDMLGKDQYEYAIPFYGERRPILIDLVLKPDQEIETKYVNIERQDAILVGDAYTPALGDGHAYMSGTAAVLRNSKGNVVGAIESVRDISERRRMEVALKESEERYRLIFDHAPLGIVHFDHDGVIQDFNGKFMEIIGTPRERILGFDMLKGLQEPGMRQAVEDALAGELGYFEGDCQCVTGCKEIPIRAIYKRITATDGTFLGGVGLIEDIAERKRAEEDKERLEARLRQAQKMEAVGTLAGGIAHDFNNILMAIGGYTEMAMHRLPGEDLARQNLAQVLKAANRAKELVNQILTFSRHREQERSPVAVVPIVKEALKLMRASLPSTIEIRQNISVPPEKSLVLADPTQVHQIMMNLCTNAADAMSEAGGTLEVTLEEIMVDSGAPHQDLGEGPHVQLTVRDTGQGMEREVLERIFDPFFTTKRPGKGTGMGLAVVHGIVTRHGGAITVSSEPEMGSTFRVYLPLIRDVVEMTSEPQASETPTGSENILFIDDEETLVALGKQILEHLGYTVTATTNSIEALNLFRSNPEQFDLIVTDMTMPHMTGIDLAMALMDYRADIPIILCTGFSEKITEENAKSLGIREFIMKPFAIQDVAQTVRKVLDERNGEDLKVSQTIP